MMNYQLSAIEKKARTIKVLETLTERYPENTTITIVKSQILDRIDFMSKTLDSWFTDGIEEKWDAETISNGKSACMGHIDAMELFAKDFRDEFNNQAAI